MTNNLNDIAEAVRETMNAKNDARDKAIVQSRELIRHCAGSIRAIHRREWDEVQEKLAIVQEKSDELRAVVADYPELYHSGYTQDALKRGGGSTHHLCHHSPRRFAICYRFEC